MFIKKETYFNKKGFSMIFLTSWLLVIGIFAGVLIQHPEKNMEIRKEKLYIKILSEYSIAISRFVWLNNRNPESIDELEINRNLRQIYKDPFTGKREWDLKKNGQKVVIVTKSARISGNGTSYSNWWVDNNFILHKNFKSEGD